MALMIPQFCNPASVEGEQFLFKAMQKGGASSDWVVFHSMKLSTHPSQLRGETDFVILIPNKGVLIVEVKSYSGEIREGYSKHRKDPVEQVQNETISIRHYLESRRDTEEFKRLPFVSLVVYPFGYTKFKGTAYADYQFLDADDFAGKDISKVILKRFEMLAENVYERLGEKSRKASMNFHAQSFDKLKDILTSSLGFYESAQTRINIIGDTIFDYTEEQNFLMKALFPHNKRLIVSGSEGTGKTLVAIELARIAKSNSEKTLFICATENLADHIQEQTQYSYIPQNFLDAKTSSVSTMRGLLKSACPNEEYKSKGLENCALNTFSNIPDDKKFDLLIVDETQDLFSETLFSFLNSCIKGGIDSGKWIMFGNYKLKEFFETPQDKPLLKLVANSRPAICVLSRNCRNPKPICDTIKLFGSSKEIYEDVAYKNYSEYPVWNFYSSKKEEENLLDAMLKDAQKKVPNPSEIVVLSQNKNGIAKNLADEFRWKNLLSSDIKDCSKIRFTTTQNFSGLEAMAVIITDLDEIDSEKTKEFFTLAATRSNYLLYILADAKIKQNVANIFHSKKNSLNLSANMLEKMQQNMQILKH